MASDYRTTEQISPLSDLIQALRRIERNTRGFDPDSARGIDHEIAEKALAQICGIKGCTLKTGHLGFCNV